MPQSVVVRHMVRLPWYFVSIRSPRIGYNDRTDVQNAQKVTSAKGDLRVVLNFLRLGYLGAN
jgi:hypothetical protein